ncbi:MAG TPA: redoxin domain-containing protein [Pirellulales bacterium]|nr:redoxin domain-containing protein [Pirellulales bacterium]
MSVSTESRISARFTLFAAVVSLAGLPFAVGCSESGSSSSPGSSASDGAPAKPLGNANDVLKKMAKAYQEARTYEDAGQFTLRGQIGDQQIDENADFSVTLVRPNQVRIHAYDAIVVCDGDRFRATIAGLPGQVLDRAAPAELAIPTLFSDPALQAALGAQIAGAPFQLGLLLDEDPLDFILKNAQSPRMLEPKDIEKRPCYGVELKRKDGKLILWIDQQSFIVRRLEYPIDPIRELLEEKDQVKVVGLSLTANFKGARFDRIIPDTAFEFEMPLNVKLVERFNLVPPPHELLGTAVKDFAFESLDKKVVDRDALSGKIVVIDFWATWCGWCFKGLPNLQTVYEDFKDNDKIMFLAVSTDAPEVSDAELAGKFEEAKLKLPIYRDLDRYNTSVFEVEGLPTTIILGADGKVQDYEVGYKEALATELPVKLKKLLDGKNLYEEKFAAYEAGGKLEPTGAIVRNAEIAERSDPKQLKLTKLWKHDELKKAGNVLVVPAASGDDQVFVLDNWQAVVGLAADGSVKARHELELAKDSDAVVSFLRTAVDADGKRYFAGSASGMQQAHVFDHEWKTLLTFPPQGARDGLADVQLGDLDGDGRLELNLGYWGSGGARSVSLAGERIWSNDSLQNILRLALSGPDNQGRRRLLVTSVQGVITPIDSTGQSGKPIVLDGRFVRLVFAADLDGDGQAEICAIAQNKLADRQLGPDVAIGLGPEGEELWTYDLPAGMPRDGAIEMVAWGKLLPGDDSQWLFAGADGSIHIVSAKGEPIDRLNYGAPLSGLGAAQLGDRRVLLISSEQSVEALQVEP